MLRFPGETLRVDRPELIEQAVGLVVADGPAKHVRCTRLGLPPNRNSTLVVADVDLPAPLKEREGQLEAEQLRVGARCHGPKPPGRLRKVAIHMVPERPGLRGSRNDPACPCLLECPANAFANPVALAIIECPPARQLLPAPPPPLSEPTPQAASNFA